MDLAVQKIAVSGAILAHILQDFMGCSGDCDGVLFGRLEKRISSNLEDDDEQSGFREESTAIITGFFCSGTLFSFYDATGRIDSAKLARLIGDREARGGDPPIGWFVGRRNSPMRPSMRETAVTRSLRLVSSSPGGSWSFLESRKTESLHLAKESNSKISRTSPRLSAGNMGATPGGGASFPIEVDDLVSDHSPKSKSKLSRDGLHPVDMDSMDRVQKPKTSSIQTSKVFQTSFSDALPASKSIGIPPSSPCLFLMCTQSGGQQAVHTHDYRAYQYHLNSRSFEPRTVTIVNIGPAFRVQYDSFSPVVPFPLLSSSMEAEDESQSWSASTGWGTKRRETHESSRKTRVALAKEQAVLDMYSEGYKVDKLASFVGSDGMRQVPELEDLYAKMLSKLETLAKHVCESSSALAEQEKINTQMRLDLTGLD